MLAHSVLLKDFDAGRQEQAIKRIYDTDRRLKQAGVEILRIHWPRRSLRGGRTRGALIILACIILKKFLLPGLCISSININS